MMFILDSDPDIRMSRIPTARHCPQNRAFPDWTAKRKLKENGAWFRLYRRWPISVLRPAVLRYNARSHPEWSDSLSSAFRIKPLRRAVNGSAQLFPHWDWRCRPSESQSTFRRLTSPRKDRIMIYRLPWLCWRRWDWSTPKRLPIIWWLANLGWTEKLRARQVYCWPRSMHLRVAWD